MTEKGPPLKPESVVTRPWRENKVQRPRAQPLQLCRLDLAFGRGAHQERSGTLLDPIETLQVPETDPGLTWQVQGPEYHR